MWVLKYSDTDEYVYLTSDDEYYKNVVVYTQLSRAEDNVKFVRKYMHKEVKIERVVIKEEK